MIAFSPVGFSPVAGQLLPTVITVGGTIVPWDNEDAVAAVQWSYTITVAVPWSF